MLFFFRASFNVPLWLLFMSQRCVSCPVLTVDAVWGLIPASVPLTTQDPSASCVSNKTTNTSGISYITRFLPPRLCSCYTQPYYLFYAWPLSVCVDVLQPCARQPVKTGEGAWMSTNAPVSADGKELVAKSVRFNLLYLHLSTETLQSGCF